MEIGNHLYVLIFNWKFVFVQTEVAKYDQILEDAHVAARKETALHNRLWLDSPWAGFFDNRDPMAMPSTGVSEDVIQLIGKAVSSEPGGEFVPHSGRVRRWFYLLKFLLCYVPVLHHTLLVCRQVNFRLMAEYNISVSRLTKLHSRFTSNWVRI